MLTGGNKPYWRESTYRNKRKNRHFLLREAKKAWYDKDTGLIGFKTSHRYIVTGKNEAFSSVGQTRRRWWVYYTKKKKKKVQKCQMSSWNRTVKPQPYKQCPNFSDYLSCPLRACQSSPVVSCCQVDLAMPWQYRGERELPEG